LVVKTSPNGGNIVQKGNIILRSKKRAAEYGFAGRSLSCQKRGENARWQALRAEKKNLWQGGGLVSKKAGEGEEPCERRNLAGKK